jgi:hypothetical protein
MNPVQELTQQMERRRAAITALTQLWEIAVNGQCPEQRQFSLWLDIHKFEHLASAIRETGRKQSKRHGAMDAQYLVKFCSKVANDAKAAEQHQPKKEKP